jgi:dUTP pyrophosphatase
MAAERRGGGKGRLGGAAWRPRRRVVELVNILSVGPTARCAPRRYRMNVSFHRLDPELLPPQQAHPGDAGWDLVARQDCVLEPGARAAVPTGLAVAIPPGYAGLVLPRSGHARRHGIGVVNGPGLIDAGYRGEVSVLLINHGDSAVEFARGDRIAQLVIVAVPEIEWMEEDLDDTSRGGGGFGSTGV